MFTMEQTICKLVLLQIFIHHQACAIGPNFVPSNQPAQHPAGPVPAHVMENLDFQQRMFLTNQKQPVMHEDLQTMTLQGNKFKTQHGETYSSSKFDHLKHLTTLPGNINGSKLRIFLKTLDNKIRSLSENMKTSLGTNSDHVGNQYYSNSNAQQGSNVYTEQQEDVPNDKILRKQGGTFNSPKKFLKIDGVNRFSEFLDSRNRPYTIPEGIQSDVNKKVNLINHKKRKQQSTSSEKELKNINPNSYYSRMGTLSSGNGNLASIASSYTQNGYNPESYNRNGEDNFNELLQRLKSTISRDPSLRQYMENLISNALSYTTARNPIRQTNPFEIFTGNSQSQILDTGIRKSVSLYQLHHQVDQKQYPGSVDMNPSLQGLFRQQSADPATQFNQFNPEHNQPDINLNFYQMLEDMNPMQSMPHSSPFFPFRNVQNPISNNNFINSVQSSLQVPQSIPFDHNQPYIPAIHNPSDIINPPYYKPGIQSSIPSGFPVSDFDTFSNTPINPSLATITPVQATVTTTNVQSCLKQSWCALGIATAFSIAATSALAVPFFAPALFVGRRKREMQYLVLNHNNIISFIDKLIRNSEGEKMELTSMEEMFYDSISKEHEDSRQKFFQMLKSFILTNKYTILNVTIGEIQQMDEKLIPAKIVDMVLNKNIKEENQLEGKFNFKTLSDLIIDLTNDTSSDKQNISMIQKEKLKHNMNQLKLDFESIPREEIEKFYIAKQHVVDDKDQQENLYSQSFTSDALEPATTDTDPSSNMTVQTESSYQTQIHDFLTDGIEELNKNDEVDLTTTADSRANQPDQDFIVKVNNNPSFKQAFKFLNLEYENTVSFPSKSVLDDSYNLPSVPNHKLPIEHKSNHYNGGLRYHHNQHPVDPITQYQPPGSLVQYHRHRDRTPQPFYTPSSNPILQSYQPSTENYYYQIRNNPYFRKNRVPNIPTENYLNSHSYQPNVPIRKSVSNPNTYSYKQVQPSVAYNINPISPPTNENVFSNFKWQPTTTRMPDQYWKHTASNRDGPIVLQSDYGQSSPQFLMPDQYWKNTGSNTDGPIVLRSDYGQSSPQFPVDSLKFYSAVCSILQHGDVPVNEITIFIAEKCILLRYGGVI